MTMGEIIKYNRKKLKLSQEELGNSLEPPVNKAAVQKWENGTVENIRRTHLIQLADKFHITPSDLVCWKPAETEGSAKTEIIQLLTELNPAGQNELLRYLYYLTAQQQYLTEQPQDMKQK